MNDDLAPQRLRIAAISFLNTVPLMYDFVYPPARDRLAKRYDVHFTLPSICAEELKTGTSDIGIIPVAAYSSIPDLRIIPGVGIAAKNPVRSILLVSKRPLKDIASVAVDTSSRTSVALLRVLFERRFDARPKFAAEPPVLPTMLAKHDAALLIGDPALAVEIDSDRFIFYDLAHEWQLMTGLPFVFAFWAVRGEAAELAREYDAIQTFQSARDHGLAHLSELSEKASKELPFPRDVIEHYLGYHIDYTLDEKNLEGLSLFYRYASECGAIPSAPELRFL